MARGNQREKAREKNLKAQGTQKSKNTKTGAEMQRDKDALAALMRQKQDAFDTKNDTKKSSGGSGKK
ncbi:putative serf family protein [Ustulina deusta]|nr:putative serf family protein [Ustulina deusta]KAI3340390.1 putative serf family protein [Ustulina deusta]